MTLKQQNLPYPMDALSPYMSSETLEFHYEKHHSAYITNANKLLENSPLKSLPIEQIITQSHEQMQAGLFNNIAQHWNHTQFWQMMTPKSGAIETKLEAKIIEDFGSVEKFKSDFCEAGMTQFGSGWAWLVHSNDGKLKVMKTANAENPLITGNVALLGADVWEHSYYIDYRNARPKYLEVFINELVNWEFVAEKFEAATK